MRASRGSQHAGGFHRSTASALQRRARSARRPNDFWERDLDNLSDALIEVCLYARLVWANSLLGSYGYVQHTRIF